jgi:hypothetical protein
MNKTMSQLSNSPNSVEDERLADFTDQVLAGRVDRAEADADEETIALEETILRMKAAFPTAALDQAAIKKMQVRFKARVKREAQEVKQPFWKKWFEPQPRLQFAMAFAVVALLIAFAVLSPISTTAGSSTSATAMTPVKGIFVATALAGVLFVFLWINRRK